MAPPVLLCIGGGFAGAFCAKNAAKAGFNVILVDQKDFFAVTFSSLRASVDPEAVKGYSFKYADIPGIGTFKQGTAKSLTATQCVLQSGEVINFDYCCIATGSTNKVGIWGQPQGTKIEERKKELEANAERIKKAQKIIVVGSGATGVEMVGEILDKYAGKKVTLICSSSKLHPEFPQKVTDAATKWLTSHGVQIMYNEKANPGASDTQVALKSGNTLDADLVIWSVGATPNTEWLKETELASALDGGGRVKVDPATLRVAGFPNIFALGDINDVPETKMGYLAGIQGKHTAANLALLLKDKNATLKPYKLFAGGKPPLGFITLGKSAGTGAMGPSCVFPSCIVAMAKSKNLFVDQTRKELGVK